MTDLQPVRGTHDLIGEDQRRHQPRGRHRPPRRRHLRLRRVDHADLRGHPRVLPHPRRDLRRGDEGDVHASTDRGGDSVTLRPEGTAGICRALVTNGLTQSLPQKVFYAGPMFRYERPQKGRYRQFHQIGIELIGPAEPLADAEVIACGWDILQALGVAARHGAGAQHARRQGKPRRPTAPRWSAYFTEHQATRCRRTAWPGSNATRCASSTARTRATAASWPTRRPSPPT